MTATSPNPDAYVRRIMASPGWSGSVVIEATANGAEIFWRTEEQGKDREDYGPDAVGPTILDALARAAAAAEALAENGRPFRCGECGGELSEHRCADCGTLHGSEVS